ncbi:MAG: cytochrome D1 domain-containing protein, partial [Burkholderiales bacterium]
MKRRRLLATLGAAAIAPGWLGGCAASARTGTGTGDLGIVVERARGTVAIVNTSTRTLLAEVPGLGDLSHASVVFARDGASAFVFGRDGALTRVNLLQQRIDARVMQAGNSIGGAISADGTLVAAQNYTPGGVKVFDARTLELVADIPAFTAQGQRSRVVGLVDLPGRRFAYALFDAEAICIADLSQPGAPRVTRFDGIGRQPYDALVTP